MKHTLQSTVFKTGCVFAAVAVTLGAFGAHYLKERLELRQIESFETGVRYQLIHALTLMLLAACAPFIPQNSLKRIFGLFITGIVLFSGSVFLLSTRGLWTLNAMSWLGPVTPLGGICLISAWVWLVFTPFQKAN